MKQIPFGKKIGTNPKMILVHNNKMVVQSKNDNNGNDMNIANGDNIASPNNNDGDIDGVSDDDLSISYLHIIGGSHNKYHILYNLDNHSLKSIYQLPYPNGLMYHGLLYCKSQSTLLLFGGVYYNNSTASIQYSSDFWIFNLLNNNWNKINHKKLPKQMSGFGYILYNDRVIIIFGGKVYGDKSVNNIYYLDILNTNSSWNESAIKAPLKGGYHAILEKDIIENQNDKIHLFYCAGDKEHFIININDLLPKSLLNLSRVDNHYIHHHHNDNRHHPHLNQQQHQHPQHTPSSHHHQQQQPPPQNTSYHHNSMSNKQKLASSVSRNIGHHPPPPSHYASSGVGKIATTINNTVKQQAQQQRNMDNYGYSKSPILHQMVSPSQQQQQQQIQTQQGGQQQAKLTESNNLNHNNMNNNNNNNNKVGIYNAIWIDKSKLGAKSRIECTPFYLLHRNVIIYSAEYNIYDENQGGIYEYDNTLDKHILIEKFEDHKYYPSGHTCIYNEPTEEIIFIGGKNVKNNRKPYETMMIYDVNDHSMTKILFKRAIGSDPKLLLIGDDLHIIGGSHNTYHLCYNTSSNELKPIYPFPYSNGLSGHGLLHCKLNNTIITFGGAYYDYISCSYQFCNDYWVYNMSNHKYQCIYKKTLPQTINGFGYILYANRIVITFGGSIQRNKFIDNIYYTDILNINDSWKEASIKCPKKGGYHAILIDNEIVHLIHFGKEQFCMNIKDLLPAQIIKANQATIDQIRLEQQQQHMQNQQNVVQTQTQHLNPLTNPSNIAIPPNGNNPMLLSSNHPNSPNANTHHAMHPTHHPQPAHIQHHHPSSNVLRAAQSVQQQQVQSQQQTMHSPHNQQQANSPNDGRHNHAFSNQTASFLHETPSLKELLSEYQTQIQALQSDNHRLKLDNAMFKSQMYAFEEDRKNKEFTIAKLQKELDLFRINCTCHRAGASNLIYNNDNNPIYNHPQHTPHHHHPYGNELSLNPNITNIVPPNYNENDINNTSK